MLTDTPDLGGPRKLESQNIVNALRRGTVPASGLERIAVGLEMEEEVIKAQLDYVSQGAGTPSSSEGIMAAERPSLWHAHWRSRGRKDSSRRTS